MKHRAQVAVDAAADRVGEILADLSTYPHWNDLVRTARAVDHDGAPAWLTTLEARVGLFARSKQLRFVRTVDEVRADGGRTVRFERSELDDRNHAAWVMMADVQADGSSSAVTIELSYDGGLWTAALEPVLGVAIDRSTRRLASYVSAR